MRYNRNNKSNGRSNAESEEIDMQTEVPEKTMDQALPPAHPNNIEKVLRRINQCHNPQMVLKGLLAIKPLIEKRDH